MIFTNRFDKVSLDNSIDDMAFKTLTYSFDGTKQTIDAEIDRVIDEYRYIIVEDMLFSVTDYEQSRTNTKLTAVDFVHKIGQTITLQQGTYTLLDLLRRVNKNATVNLANADMPQIDVNDGVLLTSALDDLVTITNSYITVSTGIDFENASLYNVHADVMKIGTDIFDKVDDVVLIDEVNSIKHYNPQLDLAKRITFSFEGINDKDRLNTWRDRLSSEDYWKLERKIDGEENSIGDNEAHDILAHALEFDKSVFKKPRGDKFIYNNLDIVDDGIPYDLGSIAFGSFNQVSSRLITLLLDEYKQVDYPNRTITGNLRMFKIIGIDGNLLYRATNVEFDIKKRRTKHITMLLADYFKETNVQQART